MGETGSAARGPAAQPHGRRHQRYQLLLPVRCEVGGADGKATALAGWTLNISEEAACLELPEALSDGTPVRVHLGLGSDPLPLDGRVVWAGESDDPLGIPHGVSFTPSRPAQRQGLRSLLRCPSVLGDGTGTYRVVYAGEHRPGIAARDVEARLAQLLQASVREIRRVPSGPTRSLKRGLDRLTAERYLLAFAAAGAVCRLEPEPHTAVPEADVQRLAAQPPADGKARKADRRPGARSARRYALVAGFGLLAALASLALLRHLGSLPSPLHRLLALLSA